MPPVVLSHLSDKVPDGRTDRQSGVYMPLGEHNKDKMKENILIFTLLKIG